MGRRAEYSELSPGCSDLVFRLPYKDVTRGLKADEEGLGGKAEKMKLACVLWGLGRHKNSWGGWPAG
jgi:hypothetical protein